MNTPILIDKNGVFTIEYRSRYLYSKINPLRIERVISNLELKGNTLYIFPSPLLFYGVEILIERLPNNSSIIFIEVDDALYNLNKDHKNYYNISTGFDYLQVLNKTNFSQIRSCEILPLTGGYNLNKGIYDRLFNITLTFIHNFWQNRVTQINLGQLWVKNLIRNSRECNNDLPISSLEITCPIVVVGAGESLEDLLDFIKRNSSNIYILCVDTALEALLQGGIVPDGVIALEAQYYNLPDFYGAKDLTIDLFYDLTSYPGVLRNLKGRKYYTLTKYEESRIIDVFESNFPESTLPPLGSVGITALYIALKLTKSEIYLCGLDFSYKMDKSHSRGTPYHLSQLEKCYRTNSLSNFKNSIRRPLIYKNSKSDKVELTDKILYDYSLKTRELLEGNSRVFDLTNRGLPITKNLLSPTNVNFSIVDRKRCINSENLLLNKQYQNIKKDIDYIANQFSRYIKEEIAFDVLKGDITRLNYLFNYISFKDTITPDNIISFYYSLQRIKRRSGIS